MGLAGVCRGGGIASSQQIAATASENSMDAARNKAKALALYGLMFNQGQPAEAVRPAGLVTDYARH